VQYIDGKTHIKLLKFTLIAPYLPLFNTKTPTKSRGTVRGIYRNDTKYSDDYVITYLWESQI